MPLLVAEPNWAETLRHIEHAYFKLALIVGSVDSGKSAVLDDFAKGYNFARINLGLALSDSLRTTPVDLQAIEAEPLALSILSGSGKRRLAIDNIEILFEAPLKIDVLRFLKEASKECAIVATWTGEYSGTSLSYGIPGHPAHKRYDLTPQDTFSIIPSSILR